ncbi:MAG: hypothetical protein AB8B55_12420 [Mariniblastus sp.]
MNNQLLLSLFASLVFCFAGVSGFTQEEGNTKTENAKTAETKAAETKADAKAADAEKAVETPATQEGASRPEVGGEIPNSGKLAKPDAPQGPTAEEKAAKEKLAKERAEKKTAHEKVMKAAKTGEVVTLLDELKNPTGVAIQPETGHVFVADSGNFRVVRFADGMMEPVITDFPKDKYGKDPTFDVGPLGLLFLDKTTLVVGGGGKPDGEEMLRVYKIAELGSDPIKADKMHGEAKMLPAADEVVGEGNFYGLAKGDKGIYVTCNGDDVKGWVSIATVEADKKLKEFARKIPTKELVEIDAPVAITISPEGHITVGQMGEINEAGDSQLTFYDEEGEMLANFALKLNDISGLAYGPKFGRLFATDFNWLDEDNGGLYKIIGVGDSGCKTEEMAKLKRPTALAFDPEGNLFVTLSGDADKPNGQLVVIKGLDVDQKEKERLEKEAKEKQAKAKEEKAAKEKEAAEEDDK